MNSDSVPGLFGRRRFVGSLGHAAERCCRGTVVIFSSAFSRRGRVVTCGEASKMRLESLES